VTNTGSTATSTTSAIQSRSFKHSLRGHAAEASHPAVNLSDLAQWRTACAPLARRSPAWAPPTHELMRTATSTAAPALC
jgi:hypothetical protein